MQGFFCQQYERTCLKYGFETMETYVLVPQNDRALVVSFPKKVLGGVDMERDGIVFSKLDEL